MRLLLLCSCSILATAQEAAPPISADQLIVNGRYADAEAAYSELLRSSPGTPDFLLKRGSVRIVLGRYAAHHPPRALGESSKCWRDPGQVGRGLNVPVLLETSQDGCTAMIASSFGQLYYA
jgi:hypothetical protein